MSFGKWIKQTATQLNPGEGEARIKLAAKAADLTDSFHRKPDLRIPLILNVLLLFCFLVVGNIAGILYHGVFNIWFLTTGMFFLFLSSLVYPTLYWLFLVYAGLEKTNLSFTVIVGLYNYTNLYYILACLIAIVPNRYIKWLGFIFAFIMSLMFLFANITSYCALIEFDNKNYYFAVVVICQVMTFLMFKTGFFLTWLSRVNDELTHRVVVV